MKQTIIFLLCLFPFIGKANPYDNIRSLKAGDWIQFELVGYHPVEGKDSLRNYWDDRNLFRQQTKATVLEINDKTLRMGFQYEYFSDSYEDKDKKEGFYYFDTRFAKDLGSFNKQIGTKIEQAFDLPSDIYPTENVYDLKTGKILDGKTIFENNRYEYHARYISNGIQSDSTISAFWLICCKSIDVLPQTILGSFIRQWDQGELPLRIVQNADGYPTETRVTAASFELPHNVKLFVKDGTNPENNTNTSFFCAYPQKYNYARTTWLVSPGDSVVLDIRADRGNRFSGTVAAENNFQDIAECNKLNLLMPIIREEVSAQEGLKKWNAWYDDLFQKYEAECSDFWKKSFQLNRNYCNANYLLDGHTRKREGSKITFMDWNQEIFGTLSPQTDYLYLPSYDYEHFFTKFCSYKAGATMTDNLSALRANSLDYYFAKQVLFGYPSYTARTYMLKREMTDLSNLSEIDLEYKDFMDNCHYPNLVKEVQDQYDLYKKIEPGQKIQNAGFEWLKEMDFSDKGKRSYTLICISHPSETPIKTEVIESLNKQIEENGLSGKLNMAFYYPDSEKGNRSKAKNVTYQFLSSRDLYKHLIYDYEPMTFLVRNDGTILYRSLSSNPLWEIRTQINLIHLIKGDMQNPTPQVGFFYWKEMLLALFISGLIFFLWARFKQQKEKRKRMFVELEQKALRSQMNPHFIFNALSSIQSLILHKQTEKADRYLINFSKLLRMVLKSSQKELVPLSEEINQIQLYVDLEQLRLPFDIAWNIENGIDTETIEIPGMLIQPLVENAIKHGIVPCGGGILKIDITLEKKSLHIVIEDNGNGADKKEIDQASGLGIKNIRERIKLYKEKYHINIIFTLENKKEGSGCKADLQIPIE